MLAAAFPGRSTLTMSSRSALAQLNSIIGDLEARLSTDASVAAEAPAAGKAAPATPQSDKKPSKKDANAAGDGAHKKTQKKQKNQGAARKAAAPVDDSPAGLFKQTFIQVSKIVEANPHPDADALLVCKLDVGEQNGGERTLVAGIARYYSIDELKGRLVPTILNLKPAKLRGIMSEAMLLAADSGESPPEKVCILDVPAGSNVGDRVRLEGCEEADMISASSERISPKKWDKIVHVLSMHNGAASCDGTPLVTANGSLSSPLPDGAGIH